jgi:hypothetical protein
MSGKVLNLSYEIELQIGEKLSLPDSLLDSIGVGRWVVTIQPVASTSETQSIRNHQAFLNGYAHEDEGLYDDWQNQSESSLAEVWLNDEEDRAWEDLL